VAWALLFCAVQALAAVLPNGWSLTPAGRQLSLKGDMVTALRVSPDGRFLVALTDGFHDHGVTVIDRKSVRSVSYIDVNKAFTGLAFGPSGTDIYVAGGGSYDTDTLKSMATDKTVDPLLLESVQAPVLHLSFDSDTGKTTLQRPILINGLAEGPTRWTSGIAASTDDDIFIVNTNTDTLYELTREPRQVTGILKLGYRPMACALSPDGRTLAVANWGDRSVDVINALSMEVISRVQVGSHPCALTWVGSGVSSRLFVANSGSNSVSVISDADSGWTVHESVNTALTTGALVGSTPLALAASPDGKRLFVANADNNDVAVVDISDTEQSRVLGFIPTGWYPSALAVSPDGRTLYVGVGKGLQSRANWPAKTQDGQTQPDGSGKLDYVGDCLSGAISIVDLPDAATLAHYTRQVMADVPHPSAPSVDAVTAAAAFHKIKHILYIIRENRTYDQVFGDIKFGNGDPSLVLFGEAVTPNAHKIAQQTVLLDNLFVNGEVSEDGHQWCNATYATDFIEKAWENRYSGRGEPDADGRLTESPGGYLWDDCARHGLTYRTYGEFAGFHSSKDSPPVFTGDGSLEGHASEAWSKISAFQGGRDNGRADVFVDELHAAERAGTWPNFMVMHLEEDHTTGLSAGEYTPAADVADNDQALGKIVEAVSKSKFWASTAIFVIEDDAQDGPDHVDCHRTVGLLISPYVRHGFVDHTHYTTASFVRTMELILKLPPMSQYDEYASPLYAPFVDKPVMTAYVSVPTSIDLDAKNPATGPGAAASAKLDFSDVDRADPQTLNRILRNAMRPGTQMPAPVRSVFQMADYQSQFADPHTN
jgi:YVTN family beta-propeller protein